MARARATHALSLSLSLSPLFCARPYQRLPSSSHDANQPTSQLYNETTHPASRTNVRRAAR
jgi:hypothetical protein